MNENHKVVLVCMDEFINELYQKEFKKVGIDLIAINHTDGKSVDKIADIMPVLILMGITMADINGNRLTELLKADPRTKPIRIIGFSNVAGEEEIKKSLQLGMDDYWVMGMDTIGEISSKVLEIIGKDNLNEG